MEKYSSGFTPEDAVADAMMVTLAKQLFPTRLSADFLPPVMENGALTLKTALAEVTQDSNAQPQEIAYWYHLKHILLDCLKGRESDTLERISF